MREQNPNVSLRSTQRLQQHSGGACFAQRHGMHPDIAASIGSLGVVPKTLFYGLQIAHFFAASTLQLAAQQRL
jgi:hypothetical protein